MHSTQLAEPTEQDTDSVNLRQQGRESLNSGTSSQTCHGAEAHLRGTSAEGEPEVLPRIRHGQGWAPTMIHHMGGNCQDCKPDQELRDVRQWS